MMRGNSTVKIGMSLVIVAALFVLLNLAGSVKNIRGFFYSVSSPVQQGLWKAGGNVSDFFSGIFNAGNLKRENEALKSQISGLEAKVASLSELEKENENLREALGAGLADDFNLVFANVTGKDVSGDFIIIDKGAKDGLSAGMPVVTAQKTLVGRISESYERFSKIILISKKDFSFDAKIPGTDIFGVAKGKGNFTLSLELVPREADLKEGDLVSTASLGGLFPEGILIGSISSIRKSDVESFQSAEIKISWESHNLNDLFILVNF